MTLKKISSSKYYDIQEMQNIEIPHKDKLVSLFHISACFELTPTEISTGTLLFIANHLSYKCHNDLFIKK